MAIRAIDHVNIVTTDLEGTVAFYAEAIGLERGWRPDFSFPGAWLYAGEQPVIHLAVGERAAGFAVADTGASGTGPLDHVAFVAEDFEGTRDRLAAQGVEHRIRDVPGTAIRQIFVLDPNGVKLELNFSR